MTSEQRTEKRQRDNRSLLLSDVGTRFRLALADTGSQMAAAAAVAVAATAAGSADASPRSADG